MDTFQEKIVEAIEDKKGQDIKLIDMDSSSDICSFQLICSAENTRHAQAITNAIEMVGKNDESKIRPEFIEGKETGEWVLLDYGYMIIHVFLKDTRSFYAFDSLCSGKKTIYPK